MSERSRPRMLVTGGAGFIGSHLVEELVRGGGQVTVLDNFSSGHERNLAAVLGHIELRRQDLRRPGLARFLGERNFETIFHLAGNAHVVPSVENPRRDFEMNAVSTLNLLEAIRVASAQPRLIYASSAAVYGGASTAPQREDSTTIPFSPYGVSKLAGEHYVSVYARLYGLRAASIRLFPIFGPRLRKQVVYDLMCKIEENPHELRIHGDGTQTRPLMYVADTVQAFVVVAAEAQLRGEVYNAASKETISIGQLAEMICERMGVRPQFVYSGGVRPGEVEHWKADISRIAALGYRPRCSIGEGLADTVAWFRSERRTSSVSEREVAPRPPMV